MLCPIHKMQFARKSIIDIQKQNAHLLELQHLFQTAIHCSKLGIWECDLATGHCCASFAWKQLLGYEDHEIDCFMSGEGALIHPDDRQNTLSYLEQYKKKIKECKSQDEAPEFYVEHRMRHKNGSYLWILSKGRVYADRENSLRRLIGTHTDITKEKEKEELLKKNKIALEVSNQELERFSSIASHDLKEPLHLISSYLDILVKKYEGSLDPEGIGFIGMAKQQVEQAQRLISHLLMGARTESSQKKLDYIDLNQILRETLATLELMVLDSGTEITYDRLPSIYANRCDMLQLFQNLISNAIKYKTARLLKIHIGAKERKEDWLFHIKDNGIGIDPKYHGEIFSIFTRIKGQASTEGYGIGLSICKKIVESRGGKIWLDSQVNRGTCFYFTLPK